MQRIRIARIGDENVVVQRAASRLPASSARVARAYSNAARRPVDTLAGPFGEALVVEIQALRRASDGARAAGGVRRSAGAGRRRVGQEDEVAAWQPVRGNVLGAEIQRLSKRQPCSSTAPDHAAGRQNS
jgi:hypothetical protein